jgi:regulator of sigma E protease
MEILIKAAQLILSLSILVVLHEMGHFIPAKLFKTRVEKFYLFFDPWFSLFKIKRGETEYGVGWLPLGGYVKISGMIDESMDKEQMAQPPQPWEFRSKPAWQRLIIMLGGVTVNAFLGIFIYICILAYWGEEYLPTQNLKYGIACDSSALQMGLQNGDKIIAVGGKEVENFNKIPAELIFNEAKSITIDRSGQKMDLPVPAGFISTLIKSQGSFIAPRQTIEVEELTPGSAAFKGGLLKGDKILAVDSISTLYFDQFKSELQRHKNQSIAIHVQRNGQEAIVNVTVPEEGIIGFSLKSMDNYLEFKKINYSLIEAVPAGISKAYHTFDDYIKQFKLIFSPETKAYKSLGGFITMGKIFSPVWDWERFWNLTAFLSIILAIMNLLPIPALDGGHVLFLLWEVVTRRKPNEKFMEYAQTAGMILLLALLLFANGNDIVRLFQ